MVFGTLCALLVMSLVASVWLAFVGFFLLWHAVRCFLFLTYLSVMSSASHVTREMERNITRCSLGCHLRLYWLSLMADGNTIQGWYLETNGILYISNLENKNLMRYNDEHLGQQHPSHSIQQQTVSPPVPAFITHSSWRPPSPPC